MDTWPRDDTPATWVGRAPARPPVDPWPTAEQPIVPPHFAPPPQVIYVERPRRRRGCLFTLGVLAALVAGAATLLLIASPALRGLIGTDQASPSDSPSPTPSPTPSPVPPPPPGLNEPVRDGAFEFVVHDVTCDVPAVGPELIGVRAEGQFCIIDITVTNIGSVAGIFTDAAQYVTTTDGTRRNAHSTAGLWANEGIRVWVNLVGPGSTVTGKLVFDIPVDTTIVTIELHDSPLSEGVVVML